MSDKMRRTEQIERILQLSDGVFRQLLPTVPKELLELDLTMPQMKVVLLLFLNGPARMSTLASGLGVSLATATGVADRLVERGMVVRGEQTEDRRVVLCRLSEQGHTLVSRMWTSARARARELLEAVPASQLVWIEKALEALAQAGVASRVADQSGGES